MAAKIRVDTGKVEAKVSIKLKPIKTDYIKFTSVEGESYGGPEFWAAIGKEGFDVGINAMVTVLQISVGAKIHISNKNFLLHVQGKIMNLFQADLTCIADYGSLDSAEFSV